MKHPAPIAVLCGDIHLSLTAPVWRTAEPDWFAAMARPLDELQKFANRHGVPILCAGDVFHKWNPPPELLNFAHEHLPEMYAVPGQHDLPYHISEDLDRSAFGTMVRIGRIKLLSPKPTLIRGAYVYGFGWGEPITPPKDGSDRLHVAIVHAYCWQHLHSYPDAKDAQHVKRYAEKLAGYDAAAFGDNHKGFLREFEKLSVMNCGGFMRRNSDEKDRWPTIGLLMSNGKIVPHVMKSSAQDLCIESEDIKEREHEEGEIEEFVQNLSKLRSDIFDFPAHIRHFVAERKDKLNPGVKRLLLEIISQ